MSADRYGKPLECHGSPYCVDCGGVCSQDDYDRRPYKPVPYPQLPMSTPGAWTYPDYPTKRKDD